MTQTFGEQELEITGLSELKRVAGAEENRTVRALLANTKECIQEIVQALPEGTPLTVFENDKPSVEAALVHYAADAADPIQRKAHLKEIRDALAA